MAKRLFRDTGNKMLGGVCAGLAEYLDLDATLVRLIFAAVCLMTALFPMALFYIIAWIIIPVKPADTGTA